MPTGKKLPPAKKQVNQLIAAERAVCKHAFGKGVIAPGSDADLVVWDPMAPRTVHSADLHMATASPPYEGMRVTGRPESVVVGGRPVMAAGLLTAPEPHGRHLRSGALSRSLICRFRGSRPDRDARISTATAP
jgi:N-acyl-D-aspartate/D-glutamate deacylase